MKVLTSNYIVAIVVLFFCKVVLIDQVRANFRGPSSEDKSYQEVGSSSSMQASPKLSAIR